MAVDRHDWERTSPRNRSGSPESDADRIKPVVSHALSWLRGGVRLSEDGQAMGVEGVLPAAPALKIDAISLSLSARL